MDAESNASLDLGTPVHVEEKVWTPPKAKVVNANPMMTPGHQVMKPYKVTNEQRPAMQPLVENNVWTANTARTWSLTPVARVPTGIPRSHASGSLAKGSLCAKAVKRKAKGGLGLATALTSQIHNTHAATTTAASSTAVPSLTLSPSVIGITPLDVKKKVTKQKFKAGSTFAPSAWSSCFDMNSVLNSDGGNNETIPPSGEDSTSQRLNLDDVDIDMLLESSKASSRRYKSQQTPADTEGETEDGNMVKRRKSSPSSSSATVHSNFDDGQHETPRARKTKKQKTPASEVSSTSFVSPVRTQQRSGAVKNLRPKVKAKPTTKSAKKPPAKGRKVAKRKEPSPEPSSTDVTSISALDSAFGIRTGMNMIPDGESSAYSPSGINTVYSPSIRGGGGHAGLELSIDDSESASKSVTPPKPAQSALGFSLITTPADLANKAVRFKKFPPNAMTRGRLVHTNVLPSDTATVSSIVGMESTEASHSPCGTVTRVTDHTAVSTDLLQRVDNVCQGIEVSESSCGGDDPTAVSTNLINMASSASTGDVNQFCDELSSTKPTHDQTHTASNAMSDINDLCHEIESSTHYNINDNNFDTFSVAKTDMSAPKSSIRSSLKKSTRPPSTPASSNLLKTIPQTPDFSRDKMYAAPPSSLSSFKTSKITGSDVFATPAASVKSFRSDTNYDPADIARMGYTPLKNGPIEGPVGFPITKFESPEAEKNWEDQASQWINSFNKYIDECDNVEL